MMRTDLIQWNLQLQYDHSTLTKDVSGMDTKERILSIRLIEAVKKQPEFAERLQLKAVMKEPGSSRTVTRSCAADDYSRKL